MAQYTVPQFIDIEPRIFGPITLRQFITMMVLMMGDFIIYRVFINSLILIALFAIPFTIAMLLLTFKKVNGRPLHRFLLSFIRSVKRPSLRVWNKELSDKELREILADVSEEKEEEEYIPQKAPLSRSRLTELSLIVNTGGVYHPDSVDEIEEATIVPPPKKEKEK